jgi:predicted nucleotidyltransferase
MTDPRIAALPERTRDHLERLCEALRERLGERLQAILAYGSVARGAFVPERSDVDLVVVLSDDARRTLQSIGPALELARHAARIEAMLLRADELQHAADVFPLLYDDIRGCNVVLHGTDPFASLKILDEHRRLRIEQELREARIRMRRGVAEATGAPRAMTTMLERKLKQLRSPLHALLLLRGIAVGDDAPAVLSACATRYGVDIAALALVREDGDAAHDALVRLLDAAIADVDHSEGASTP